MNKHRKLIFKYTNKGTNAFKRCAEFDYFTSQIGQELSHSSRY